MTEPKKNRHFRSRLVDANKLWMKRSIGFLSAGPGEGLQNCVWRFKQFIAFATAAGMRIADELMKVFPQILALELLSNYYCVQNRQSRRRRVYRRFLPLRRVQTHRNRHEI